MHQEASQEASYFDHSNFPPHAVIQCLHFMYAEIAWVLVFSGAQVQPQITLDPDYLPDFLSISYGHGWMNYILPVTNTEQSKRKIKQEIKWLKLPPSITVKTDLGKMLVSLLSKHVPPSYNFFFLKNKVVLKV